MIQLYDVKKTLSRFITALATLLVVILLFILQYIVINHDFDFYKNPDFWTNLIVMLVILVVVNEIYWRNGSMRGENNEKYIGSAIEYSVRINRIKNCTPCKTDDFYKFIDEKNIELFIDARNAFLEDHGISKDDYYYGHKTKTYNEDGTENIIQYKPHCEMSLHELQALTHMQLTGEIEPYYTRKQIRVIQKAVQGKFSHEVLNGTEILSGIKVKHNKYATSYSAHKNRIRYSSTGLIITLVLSIVGALLDPRIREEGITTASMFLFMYRLLIVAYRAITSDEAGYRDIVETKRGVNINRANITTMYATARGLNLFTGINEEIAAAKEQYFGPTIIKETTTDGLQT